MTPDAGLLGSPVRSQRFCPIDVYGEILLPTPWANSHRSAHCCAIVAREASQVYKGWRQNRRWILGWSFQLSDPFYINHWSPMGHRSYSLYTFITVQPSWISPIGINVTKPMLEEQMSLVPNFKTIESIHLCYSIRETWSRWRQQDQVLRDTTIYKFTPRKLCTHFINYERTQTLYRV